jgi:hypothetical protein
MYILLVSGLADSHPRSRRYGSCCALLAALLWAKKHPAVWMVFIYAGLAF